MNTKGSEEKYLKENKIKSGTRLRQTLFLKLNDKIMFEDIQQHRAAVAENIQKAMEIGFTGNELEKAHKVGDIHPNGKWVWTQLPSGKYDWRVIKKTSAGSGTAAPSTSQKTAQSGKKEEEVKGFINILKQKPNERHLEQMDVDELKRFIDTAHKCWLDDENLNRSTRLQCKEWRDLAKKEIASKDEEARATQQENEYRKQHPNSTTKNSDIKQQASAGKKDGLPKIPRRVDSEEIDSFIKNVSSGKYRFYLVDKVGGVSHKVGRITSIKRNSDNTFTVRLHWMGNGENETKKLNGEYSLISYLNRNSCEVEKKK
jgi:hypothetical protein